MDSWQPPEVSAPVPSAAARLAWTIRWSTAGLPREISARSCRRSARHAGEPGRLGVDSMAPKALLQESMASAAPSLAYGVCC